MFNDNLFWQWNKFFECFIIDKERVSDLFELFNSDFVVIFEKLKIKFINFDLVLFLVCEANKRSYDKLMYISLRRLDEKMQKVR